MSGDDVPEGAVLGDLGEAGVLQAILPSAPRSRAVVLGPGDDAALVAAPDGQVVATTDLLVEGRDFRRDWGSGADVGWKAAAQNLADVAAMGAHPSALLMGLAAPPDLPVAWARELMEGLAACCEPWGVGLAGGDLSAAHEVVVAVTALGDLRGAAPVRRDGARPGDVVALAGVLGHSGAGLALLTEGLEESDLAHAGYPARALAAPRRPAPPLSAGPAAALAGAHALMDVSDGLLRDAGRIAAASGVVVDLDESALDVEHPLLMAVGTLLDEGVEPRERCLRWVLTGGEDHGLLATFAPGAALPEGFRAIGTVREVGSVLGTTKGPTVLMDGRPLAAFGGGFDHFS